MCDCACLCVCVGDGERERVIYEPVSVSKYSLFSDLLGGVGMLVE